MVYRYSCSHLATATDIPITSILNSKELQKCADCDSRGPDLWICLFRNCLKIGCSEKPNDHSTAHNINQPTHCIHMNLTSKRIWCYACKCEVFMENSYESDGETEASALRSRDSGHGSYSTLRTTTPDRELFPFERTVGLNVGMGGDGSESSEEEPPDYIDKPSGLVGLQNIGNTCYMNAALQALSNAEPLTRYFLDCVDPVLIFSEGRKPGLSLTYQALMRDIWVKKNGGYVTPSGILYGIRNVHAMFRGYHQHDTQEFLRNFMDQLHEELKQPAAPEPGLCDGDTFSLAMEEPLSSSYDSSEGEYETCDSGVSERSSLSDDNERPANHKRRLSRCASPNRRQRQRVHSTVIDSQPTVSKKQAKFRSIISDVFDGKLLSSVQCLTCDRVSSRVETFQDLSLPIPSRDHLVLLHGRAAPGSTCTEGVLPVQDGWISWLLTWLRSWFYGPTVTLHNCLAAFFSTDELKGDNMYSCEKCNKLRNGIKFSKVMQLPEILCIHLKRFRHELMSSSKISSTVSFPLKGLEMQPYLHSECTSKVSTYDLFSVICHHGTAGGGHYICYAHNSNQWYEFDDQYVTKVTPEKVQTCEAYVLFYRKVQTSADEVRSKVVKLAEDHSDSLRKAFVSKQWINRFNYCAEPGAIDNSDFLCHHGAVCPERSHQLDDLAIQLPLEVYEYLLKKFGGCPAITSRMVCPACQALQKRIMFEAESFVQITNDAQDDNTPSTHYLSTSWYNQWHAFVQKHSLEPPGPIDNSRINVNQLDNEAAEVTEAMWEFFYNIYGGGPELRIRALERADSSSSVSSQKDQDEAKNSSNHSNGLQEFVIPTLKKEKSKGIDKSLYGHGEPMDTEVYNGDCKENEETGTESLPSKAKHIENGETLSVNGEEDIDEEEDIEIRNTTKRSRRRRKNLVSIN